MAATPEKRVKTKVRSILKSMRAFSCAPMTAGYGESGVPDILACYCGHFVGIECKANGNRPTALQEAKLADIERAGGLALVIDENNVDVLQCMIEDFVKIRL